MKKQDRRHSLLKRVFGRPRPPSAQPPRREPAINNPAPREVVKNPPTKAVVKWLRRMPLNRPFRCEPSLMLSLALRRGYCVPTVLGDAYALTKAGLEAGWPWVTETFFRSNRNLWEGICCHGTGHPIAFDPNDKTAGIHSCDGCCGTEIR
jgi:hypothetical protein